MFDFFGTLRQSEMCTMLKTANRLVYKYVPQIWSVNFESVSLCIHLKLWLFLLQACRYINGIHKYIPVLEIAIMKYLEVNDFLGGKIADETFPLFQLFSCFVF